MQRITRQELRNLSDRVLTFYKTRMDISSDIYCVIIEELAEYSVVEYSVVVEPLRRLKLNSVVGVN